MIYKLRDPQSTGKGRPFFVPLVFTGLKDIINLLQLEPTEKKKRERFDFQNW